VGLGLGIDVGESVVATGLFGDVGELLGDAVGDVVGDVVGELLGDVVGELLGEVDGESVIASSWSTSTQGCTFAPSPRVQVVSNCCRQNA